MITHFNSDLCTLQLALLCLLSSFVKCCCRGRGILGRGCRLLRSCRAGFRTRTLLMAGNSSLGMSFEVDRAIDNFLTLENDQH